MANEIERELWIRKNRRNVQGRLLMNVERKLGLAITAKEDVEALFPDDYEAQEEFLKNRLEELGGAQLRPAMFCLDNSPTWPGYTYGETWNGWACPCFEKEIADEIVAFLQPAADDEEWDNIYYDAERDVYVCTNAMDPDAEPWEMARDENGMFHIMSGCYCWDEVTEDAEESDETDPA